MSAKTQGQVELKPSPADDRRREPRHFICFGRPIHIRWMTELSLIGTLVEVSRSGFRMVHQYRRFEVGQEVKVTFPWGEVKARVAWSRAGKKNVQTGFALIDAPAQKMPYSE